MTGGAARTAKRVRIHGKWNKRAARGHGAPPYPPTPCPRPRQEGDEFVCVKCAHRWDVHEEKPPCPRD